MKKTVLILFLWVSCMKASATCMMEKADTVDTLPHQTEKKLSLLRRLIRGFDRLDERYIEPQHYVFTVMLQTTYTYDSYTMRSTGQNSQRVNFSPDGSWKVGPYVGWKWIFGGYSFSLGHSTSGKGKTGLELSIYSSQVGVDLFYRRTGRDYKLRNMRLGQDIDTKRLEGASFDGVRAGITGISAYYIFNHGRFSYPAAFAQSTCQKISCGSWLAGVGYTDNTIELDHQKLQELMTERLAPQKVQLDSGLMFNSMSYRDLTLSGGYAYNWVFARNWLFCASGQLGVAYKYSSGNLIGSARYFIQNVNADLVGRFALVYNDTRWYAGISAIVRSNNYRKNRFMANNTFGTMSAYVGYNFGLKKKYRKKKDKE